MRGRDGWDFLATVHCPCPTDPKADPITLHAGLADIYAGKVANLAEALKAEDTKAEAADILSSLIDKLILTPDPTAPGGHKIELFGELGAILSLCDNGMATNAKKPARLVRVLGK